jgi:archaeal flagellin FlaB
MTIQPFSGKPIMTLHVFPNLDEKGQTALETAIILIAFVVVASVFAFTILSAGASTTEKGKQAIEAGLQGVRSTLWVRGSVIGKATGGNVDSAIFTLALISDGKPVNFSTTQKEVSLSYKDKNQYVGDIPWTAVWLISKQSTPDDVLEEGELIEITADLSGLSPRLNANLPFNLEIKPPTGAVLDIDRAVPSSVQTVMDLE